jgi:hypothetical protein
MGLMPDRARGIHLAVLVMTLSLCAVVLLAYLAESGWLGTWLPSWTRFLTQCPYSAWTGTPCPLCGTTTAFVFLLQGALKASLQANPLALALTPTLLAQLVYRAFRILRPAVNWREESALLAFCLLSAVAVVGGSSIIG